MTLTSEQLSENSLDIGTPSVLATPFAVKLEFFTGPMDLLLHLVQQQEVSIEEVDMTHLAEQYLAIIDAQTGDFDLEKAAEYLVVAATLLAIKSQSLLPSTDFSGLEEGLEDAIGTEFYEELRERLKQYKLTKLRAQALRGKALLGIDTFPRKARTQELAESPNEVELTNFHADAHSLGQAFGNLLKRIGQGVHSVRIRLEPISLVQYMMKTLDVLRDARSEFGADGKSRGFLDVARGLFLQSQREKRKPEDIETPRGVVIGGFISLLELVKRGLVSVSQEDGDIKVELKMLDEGEVKSIEEEFGKEFLSQALDRGEGKVVHISDYLERGEERAETDFIKDVENA